MSATAAATSDPGMEYNVVVGLDSFNSRGDIDTGGLAVSAIARELS